MPIYPYSFTLPPVNKQDIPSDGVVGEFLGINSGGQLDWLPVSGGSGSGDLLAANNLSELTPTAGTARTNLGLGTGDTPTFANLTLTSPSLSSSAPVTISQTWNAVGQTFKALVVNAAGTSDANSASGSLLADFQVNGTTKANITKYGSFIGGLSGTSKNPVVAFPLSGSYSVGVYSPASYTIQFAMSATNGGADTTAYTGLQYEMTGGTLSWGLSSVQDIKLVRDGAANTLALRNGEAPQTFRLYNTYSGGGTNFERLNIQWSGGAARIFPDAGGTGTLKTVYLGSDSVANNAFLVNGASNIVQINTSGVERMRITSAGNVGIGTTAPGSTLTVAGTLHFGSNNGALPGGTSYGGHIGSTQDFAIRGTSTVSTNYYLQNGSSGNKNAAIRLLGSGSADHGGLDINTFESSPIIFSTNLTEKARFSATGNLGIGTTAPGSNLSVVGNMGVRNAATALGTGYGIEFDTNSTLPRFSFVFNSAYSSVIEQLSDTLRIKTLGTTTNLTFGSNSVPGQVVLKTDTGNLGIGTTSPSSKLDVALNPATNYTTETVKFGNIHFANGTGGYSNLWMGSISTPLTLSASNYTLANDGTNTIINGGSGGLFFHVGAAAHWNIQSTGHLLCSSDNSRDIGASGANRPRNIYVGSDVICGSLRAVNINTANNSHTVLTFTNSSDNLLFASGQTSSRINFCGTTNLFPAIKRNGAGLDIVLANDSGFAAVQDLYRRFGAGSPEGVVTAPIGAVYHNTTGGAGTSFYVKESGTGNTGWVGK